MGTAGSAKPVKLIAGLLTSSSALLDEARAALADLYGEVDEASTPALWTLSSYYTDEFGSSITRQFVSFSELVRPDALASIKATTNALEDRWRAGSRRQVNIDPGYIGLTKLVLATTKDASHRVYLSDGIYAEPTLAFESGRFRPYAHTYPDYADAAAIELFKQARTRYVGQLKRVT